MARFRPVLGALALCGLSGLALAGCSSDSLPSLPKVTELNPFKEKPEPLPGRRIPVLPEKEKVAGELADGSTRLIVTLPGRLEAGGRKRIIVRASSSPAGFGGCGFGFGASTWRGSAGRGTTAGRDGAASAPVASGAEGAAASMAGAGGTAASASGAAGNWAGGWSEASR